jgi:hypothetical protein
LLLLSACGEAGPSPASAGTKAPPMAGQYGRAPAPLIGMDARHLFAMLGAPRLDIKDRTVRKLQFTAGNCVLDAYLYAPAQGKEPLVTHVDTRLPSGEDVNIGTCGIGPR